MYKQTLFKGLAVSAALALSACSSSDNAATNNSTFNPDAPGAENTGEPGGDITAIAGLWNGTTVVDGISDVVYWHLAANGVLTRYDYQQDGAATASGENCYIVGDPITVSPESGDDYSFFNVAITAVRSNDTMTITFIDEDKNDIDNDDDITEKPTFSWTLLTTPVLADLNSCTTATEVAMTTASQDSDLNQAATTGSDDGDLPINTESGEGAIPSTATPEKPLMTRAECATNGGTVVGDIGNGAIHRPEYRCESGLAPIARITYLEGEPIATEGEVCCI